MCRSHWAHVAGGTVTAAPEPRRKPQDRVGDRDRQASADRLSRAYGEGLLSTDELDEHLARAFGALTVADLEAAEALLPRGWLEELQRQGSIREGQRRRAAARRGELRAYAGVMLLLVVIWLVSAVSAGAWQPWPLWPALGWGIPLLLAGRGHGNPASATR